jgi:dipeptidyl aminopeptidase/acylaminoacyl peptidase
MKRGLIGIPLLIFLLIVGYADEPNSTNLQFDENSSLIPREVLFGDPDQGMIVLSPDGSKISYCAPVNGVLNIWVGPTDDPKSAKPVTKDTHNGVVIYNWAYTNEHILYLQDKDGDENWRVHCLNLSSGEIKNLTPFEGVRAWIEAMSPKFPEEIIIGLDNRDLRFQDLYRLNITTVNLTHIQENNEFQQFYIDDDYRVRLATKISSNSGREIFKRTENGDWKLLSKIRVEDEKTTGILGFDKTGTVVYIWDSRDRNTAALYALNLETGEKTLLAENSRADLSDMSWENVLIHPTERNVQAVVVNYDRKRWQVVDPSIKGDLEYLSTIEDGDFSVASRTLDDDAWIVAYAADDGWGGVYYYDRNKREARFLFTGCKELEGMPLAKMNPVIIESRDGLNLVSYYTLPLNSDFNDDGIPDKPLPTVLFVHGGPEGRDMWGYYAEHQWLANRGYAVLSVNFRGSTGFGKNFTNAGNLEWGRKMQYDLIDGVDWAVKKGIADPDRVGIMGGSYGGYAVLAGLTFTPETFACGVDMYGPSNLITLLDSEQEIEEEATSIGDPRTEEGQKLLAERSPLNYVDRIQRPLLVEQGANDPIVKRNESDQIVQVMQEKNLSVTYVLFSDEGHYIARPENNIAFYAVAESFLAQHLGGRFEFIDDDLKGSSITVPVGAEEIPGLEVALSEKTP